MHGHELSHASPFIPLYTSTLTQGDTLSCFYSPRTRMRMLNSSAVLNGQPAILACGVTSIQLPPETIRACPINQPIRYTRAKSASFCTPPPFSYSPIYVYLSISAYNPSSCPSPDTKPAVLRSRGLYPIPPFDFSPTLDGPSWQTARSAFDRYPAARVSLQSRYLAPNPVPFARQSPAPYRQFFFLPLESVPGGLSAQ